MALSMDIEVPVRDKRLPPAEPDQKRGAGAVFLAVLPYLISPLFTGITRLPVQWETLDPGAAGSALFLLLLISWMAVLVLSWKQSFPAWSFPYWLLFLILTPYMSLVATPGITIFGFPVFGNHIWGMRAWIPLIVVVIVAAAITRSAAPLENLVTRIGKDWTLVSYALFGAMPFCLWIIYDEVHGEELFASLMQVVLAGGVLLFNLLKTRRQRFLALIAGLTLAWMPSVFYINNYWGGRYIEGVGTIPDNSNLVGGVIGLAALAVVLASPGILAWIAHRLKHGHGSSMPPASAG